MSRAHQTIGRIQKGEMLALVNASPVNTPMVTDRMGYHMREGKHNIVLYDWQQYVSFADNYLK